MNRVLILAAALASFSVAPTPSAMAQTTVVETTTVSAPGFALPAGGSYMVVDPLTGRVFGDYSATVRVPAGYYVAERTSGRVVATTDASGNLVAITTAPAPTMLVKIEERRMALQRLLDDALAKNVVTVTEVAPLRAALEKIAAEEVVLRQSGGTITVAQAAPLAYRLNVIGTQVAPIVKTTTAYPALLGDRIIVRNGDVVFATTDYAARRALVDQRIQAEYDAGRLTNRQVKDLREQLVRVANIEIKRKKDGTLSSSNRRQIERRLNEVIADMQEDIASTNRRRANIGLKVE